jgi:hypothetical protein
MIRCNAVIAHCSLLMGAERPTWDSWMVGLSLRALEDEKTPGLRTYVLGS